MNVTKLIKELQKIQETNPRAKVVVKWETFESEDWSHFEVNGVEKELIPFEKEDGSYENKDGSEHLINVVTLVGRN